MVSDVNSYAMQWWMTGVVVEKRCDARRQTEETLTGRQKGHRERQRDRDRDNDDSDDRSTRNDKCNDKDDKDGDKDNNDRKKGWVFALGMRMLKGWFSHWE